MINIPILYEVMIRVEEGNLSLDDPLSMLEGDKAPGAGILQHLSAPFPLSVRDAGTLMIALSDNTATNLLLEKLGPRSVGERMSALGLQDSRVFRKVFGDPADSFDPPGSERWGLGVTSPMDLAKLLAWVHRGEAVSSGASREMLRMLDAQQHQVGLPRYLPDGVRVAHKTGTISAARHDCGIIYGPAREYVLCIMTRENEDTSGRGNNEAEVLQAELSRTIFDALNPGDPD
jgi:serine-type D-Ala-D-Ala carboxypeptidase (penicillin-binding protein 5/6)